MFKLLKWTIFLPLTLLVLCVVSDTFSSALMKLFVYLIIFPLLLLGFMVYVASSVFSEWGMGDMEIEHERVLIVINQADKQIDKHEGVIKRLNLSIEAGKRQVKEDTRAAKIENKPAPRTDGAKMTYQRSDYFLKKPYDDTFKNQQAGWDTHSVADFKTFTELEGVIDMHKREIERLEAIRKPYYETHLEFHKVRVEKQIAEVGEYWAGWQKNLREKIGNEYADNGAHTPEDVKEL